MARSCDILNCRKCYIDDLHSHRFVSHSSSYVNTFCILDHRRLILDSQIPSMIFLHAVPPHQEMSKVTDKHQTDFWCITVAISAIFIGKFITHRPSSSRRNRCDKNVYLQIYGTCTLQVNGIFKFRLRVTYCV